MKGGVEITSGAQFCLGVWRSENVVEVAGVGEQIEHIVIRDCRSLCL